VHTKCTGVGFNAPEFINSQSAVRILGCFFSATEKKLREREMFYFNCARGIFSEGAFKNNVQRQGECSLGCGAKFTYFLRRPPPSGAHAQTSS